MAFRWSLSAFERGMSRTEASFFGTDQVNSRGDPFFAFVSEPRTWMTFRSKSTSVYLRPQISARRMPVLTQIMTVDANESRRSLCERRLTTLMRSFGSM